MGSTSAFKRDQNKKIVKDFDFSTGINSQIDSGLLMSSESYSIQNLEVLSRGGLARRAGYRPYKSENVDTDEASFSYQETIETEVPPCPAGIWPEGAEFVHDVCVGNIKFDPDIVNGVEHYGHANDHIREIFNNTIVCLVDEQCIIAYEVKDYYSDHGVFLPYYRWVWFNYATGVGGDRMWEFTQDDDTTITYPSVVVNRPETPGSDKYIEVAVSLSQNNEVWPTMVRKREFCSTINLSADLYYGASADNQYRKTESSFLISTGKRKPDSALGKIVHLHAAGIKGVTCLGLSQLEPYKTGIYDAQEIGLNVLDPEPTADLKSSATSPNLQNIAILFDVYGAKKNTDVTMTAYYNYNTDFELKHHYYYMGTSDVSSLPSNLDMIGGDEGWSAWGSGGAWRVIDVQNPSAYTGIRSKVGSEGQYLFRSVMRNSGDGTQANWKINYTVYTVFSTDQGLNININEVHEVLSECNVSCWHNNRLYLGGSKSYPNVYFYSEIGNPSYFSVYNFEVLPFAADDTIVGFKKFKNNILMFGRNKTFVVTGNSTDPTSSTYITSKLVDDNLGAISKNTIQQITSNVLVFLTPQGLAMLKPDTYDNVDYTKVNVKIIDGKIKNLLNMFKSNWNVATSICDMHKYYLRFDTIEIVLNYDITGEPTNHEATSWSYNINYKWLEEYQAIPDEFKEPYDVGSLPNTKGNLFAFNKSNYNNILDVKNGALYTSSRWDAKPIYTDDGDPYWVEWFSSDLTLGLPDYRKKVKKVNALFLQREGAAYHMWIDVWIGGTHTRDSKVYNTYYKQDANGDDVIETKYTLAPGGNVNLSSAIKWDEDENGNPTDQNWVMGNSAFLAPGSKGVPTLIEIRAAGKGLTAKARLKELGANQLILLGFTTVMKDGKPKGTKSK